jgi:quercetin dioxygenase-like cupin family protein
MNEVVSIPLLAGSIARPLEPHDVVTVNDAIVRVGVIEGETPWHHHRDDELFLCWEGRFWIETNGAGKLDMRQGDLFVVPRGVEHRAGAEERAVAILLERPETKKFGDDEATAELGGR